MADAYVIDVHHDVVTRLGFEVRTADEVQLLATHSVPRSRTRPHPPPTATAHWCRSASSVTAMSATLIEPPFSGVEVTVFDSTTAVGASFTSVIARCEALRGVRRAADRAGVIDVDRHVVGRLRLEVGAAVEVQLVRRSVTMLERAASAPDSDSTLVPSASSVTAMSATLTRRRSPPSRSPCSTAQPPSAPR